MEGRERWFPPLARLDAHHRRQDGHVVVLDARATFSAKPSPSHPHSSGGSVPTATLAPDHFFRLPHPRDAGLDADGWGDGELYPHGIDVLPLPSGSDSDSNSDQAERKLRIGLVNHRPSWDFSKGAKVGPGGRASAQGSGGGGEAVLQDNAAVGANSTIEVFDTVVGSREWKHVRTIADAEKIRTPNSLAFLDPDTIVFSNDHAHKVGEGARVWDVVWGRGDWTLCSTPTLGGGRQLEQECRTLRSGEKYPNGIARVDAVPGAGGANRLFLSFSSGQGSELVQLDKNRTVLTTVDQFRHTYPTDNVHLDPTTGAMYLAGFPRGWEMLVHTTREGARESAAASSAPASDKGPASVVLRYEPDGQGSFRGPTRMVEDDGHRLSTVTSSIWDAKTKRMWLTSFGTEFITVCQL